MFQYQRRGTRPLPWEANCGTWPASTTQFTQTTTPAEHQMKGVPNQNQERPTEGIRCRGIGSKVDGIDDNIKVLLQSSRNHGNRVEHWRQKRRAFLVPFSPCKLLISGRWYMNPKMKRSHSPKWRLRPPRGPKTWPTAPPPLRKPFKWAQDVTDGHTHKLIHRCRTYKEFWSISLNWAVNGMFLELEANISKYGQNVA